MATLPWLKLSSTSVSFQVVAPGRREAVLEWRGRCRTGCPPRLRRCRCPETHFVALLLGDLAAGAPDPRVDAELGVAGNGERRSCRGCAALIFSPAGDDLVPAGRRLEAELLEDVGAVDERAHAGVPGHAVELAVVGARRLRGPRRGRRRGRPSSTKSPIGASAPASANSAVQVVPVSATSGVVPPAIEVTKRSWASAHCTNSTLSVAPVSFLKASPTSSKNALGVGVGALHDPDGERLALRADRRRRHRSFDPPEQAVSPSAAWRVRRWADSASS